LEPFFGNVKVKDYASDLTVQYIEMRKGKGADGSTIDKEVQVVRGAFSYGMKITPPLVRFMPHFPMTGEDDVRQVFVENEEDKKKLREAAAKEGSYMLGLVEIGLTYGWRRGSLLSMKVKNVDLLRETLYCSVSKNGDPNTVPLLANLKAALVPCMRGKGSDDWLFTHADGSPVRGYRKAWARVLKAAGLNPELLFHDLRRTARVAMADRNMDERWAMDLMGHKTRSCSERYNIVNMETRRKAAAMLEQPVATQQAASQSKEESQQPRSQGQTEISTESDERQDRNGHSSGIADMPKALAAGSQVQ
jgi:integrase